MPEENGKWFDVIGDFIVCPSDLAHKHRWGAHECISPGVRLVEELEIWPCDAIDFYNHQPVWDLKRLKLGTHTQARTALAEFFEAVRYAAGSFCWLAADPHESIHWKQHGWKHIWWDEVVDVWEQHKAEGAVSRAEAFGRKEIRRMFRDASNEDPEAVGRVWSLFPLEHDEIMAEFFSEAERPKSIPLPGKLAEKLINSMLSRHPFMSNDKICYPDIEIPARALRRMISAIESKGMPVRKGRPRNTVAPATLRLLLKMGRCQALQLHQVFHFLEENRISHQDQLRILNDAYPWIEAKTRETLLEFVALSPSRAANQIVSKVSGISCSALEKLGINPSRFKNHSK